MIFWSRLCPRHHVGVVNPERPFPYADVEDAWNHKDKKLFQTICSGWSLLCAEVKVFPQDSDGRREAETALSW